MPPSHKGDHLWQGGTKCSATDGPRGTVCSATDGPRGPSGSAADGPGGPIIWGTNDSMTELLVSCPRHRYQ